MFCGKVSSWLEQHPHVGWIRSRLIPPTAPAGFRALRSTKPPFLMGSGTAGPHGAGCACREPLSGRQEASWAGPGPSRSFLLLRLQGSKDQTPEPSAALFLLGKQILPCVCPSVPKLSGALGLASQAAAPGWLRASQSRKQPEPGARAVPVAAAGAGWGWSPGERGLQQRHRRDQR